MYKLSQLAEDGKIMFNGNEVADTILYVNGDYVRNPRQSSLSTTADSSTETASMRESVHMAGRFTAWRSI